MYEWGETELYFGANPKHAKPLHCRAHTSLITHDGGGQEQQAREMVHSAQQRARTMLAASKAANWGWEKDNTGRDAAPTLDPNMDMRRVREGGGEAGAQEPHGLCARVRELAVGSGR